MERVKTLNFSCAVPGCDNTTVNSSLMFFALPLENDRRRQWLQLIRRDELIGRAAQNARICEKHFDPTEIVYSSKRKTLKKTSFPHLVLPEAKCANKETQTTDELSEYTFNVAVKAEPSESLDEDNPLAQIIPPELLPNYSCVSQLLNTPASDLNLGKRKLENENIQNKKRIKADDGDSDVFFQLCDTFLSKNLADVVKEQTKIQFNCPGNRYSTEYKIFCLKLFYTSPKAYNLLKDTLCLPGKTSLNIMKTPITTEVNNSLMAILKTKVEVMSNIDRNCYLVIDTTTLKPNLFYNIKEDRIYGFHEIDGIQSSKPATDALVAMVHSISGGFKQLVGYGLLGGVRTSEGVSEWIDKLIRKLFEIGLNVRVLLTRMTAPFLDVATEKSVSHLTSYFFVDNRKIYYIFDPPHLMLLMRNDLKQYHFHFESVDSVTGMQAKWEYIRKFYQIDKEKKIRIAPKLTDDHLAPKYNARENVQLALQVFSYSVAAGMSTYRDFGALDAAAEGTIKLIEIMNDLFDFLHSSSIKSTKKYQNAYCAQGYQFDFITDMLNLFASLKVINPRTCQNSLSNGEFVKGFQITLKSLMLLYHDLNMENGKDEIYKHLMTKKLTRDCLDSFLNEARSKIPARNIKTVPPTSWQLATAFRKFVFINDLRAPKKNKHINDLAKVLLEGDKLYSDLPGGSNQGEKNNIDGLPKRNAQNVVSKENSEIKKYLTSIDNAINRDEKTQIVEHYNIDSLTEEKHIIDENMIIEEQPINDKSAEVIILAKDCMRRMPYISVEDYNKFTIPEKDAFVCFSKFLIQRSLQKHKYCDEFNLYVGYDDLPEEYNGVPPSELVKFVEALEEIFNKFFKQNHIETQVIKTLMEKATNVVLRIPCDCFPFENYSKMLFFRMRLFLSLQYNNRGFRGRDRIQKFYHFQFLQF